MVRDFAGGRSDLKDFFQNQSEALQNAAVLLGGQPALRCVHALLDDLTIQPSITRRMKTNLVKLQKVLTLENVHDMDRIEAALFAEIDPASPIVEEICLLSDQLDDLLQPILSERHEAYSAVPV
ncbi:hypothetical protein [Leisingera aquaemixtae]|jgi:hypothetical protein|nr:hypothetical protein [Leisingera aquaemixtae]QDI76927.1 hypothetical protein R2C4_14630 [Leisingera aquaemixtae]